MKFLDLNECFWQEEVLCFWLLAVDWAVKRSSYFASVQLCQHNSQLIVLHLTVQQFVLIHKYKFFNQDLELKPIPLSSCTIFLPFSTILAPPLLQTSLIIHFQNFNFRFSILIQSNVFNLQAWYHAWPSWPPSESSWSWARHFWLNCV